MIQTSKNKYILVFLDSLIFIVSLYLAWFLREQLDSVLPKLLVSLNDLAIIIPIILIIRLIINMLFDTYSVRVGSFNVYDISRIIITLLIPSLIFITLRLASPVALLRLPFSVILVEFALSFFGVLLVRLLLINYMARIKKIKGIHYRSVLLYGDLNELQNDGDNKIFNDSFNIIEGILSPNPLQWNSAYKSIPVHNGIDAVERIMKYNDTICGIIILDVSNITSKIDRSLKETAEVHNLQLYTYADDMLSSYYLP